MDDLPPRWRSVRFPGLSQPAAAGVLAHFFRTRLAQDFRCVICPGMLGWYFYFRPVACPVITVYHGNYAAYCRAAVGEPRLQRLHAGTVWAKFERLSGIRSTCVSVSESVQHQIAKYYHLRSAVIYNTVDFDEFAITSRNEARAALGWSDDRRTVLFVGRPTAAKGFFIFEKLAARMPELRFVSLLSASPPSRLYPENMTLVIRPSPPIVPLLYSASDMFLSLSQYEGCSRAHLEAMATNTPIVTTRTGMFLDAAFAKPPHGIRFVEAREIGPISQALRESPDRGSIDLRSLVARHCSPERYTNSYLALIENLPH